MTTNNDLFEQASVAWDTGNLTQAFDLFLSLAERGDTASQNNLGYFYDKGLGVAPNKHKAKYWYEKAIENGEDTAVANLALLLLEEGDIESAVSWFNKAVALGDGDAALELAKLYLNEQSLNNWQKAKECLDQVFASDSVTPDSLDEAQRLYKQLQQRAR